MELIPKEEIRMDDRTLVAIMAAIIFSGADDNEKAAGYSPISATVKARDILKATDDLLEDRKSHE